MQFPDISPYVPLLGPYEFNVGSLHVGPIGVRWYAMGYIAGIVIGWRYCLNLLRTEKLWGPTNPPTTALLIDDLVLWVTLGVVGGGRLGSVLFYNTSILWKDPLGIFRIWDGGMSFHGGMIGVAVALFFFARSNKIDLLRLADLIAPCVPFGLFFVRIANFINGELWGRVTHVPWAMVFCNATIRAASGGDCPAGLEPRHPSQLYEATLEGIVLFLVLRWATHRAGWLQRQGAIVGLFLTCYGPFRIAMETVREPDAGMPNFPLGLTMGMILSTPMVLAGLWLIRRALRQPLAALPAE